MICVSLVAIARLYELVARHARHRAQQALVVDSARSKVGISHLLPLQREPVGLEFRNQGRFSILPMVQGLKSRGCPGCLLFSLADSDVETNHVVLIAHTNDGDITADV